MERRDWALKALNQLTYIDSLDSNLRASELVKWNEKYLSNNDVKDFDLEKTDLKRLLELFYKNINFLKNYKEETRISMVENRKLQRFLKH